MRRPATATAVLTAPCHAPPARPPRAARHAWAVRLTRRLGSYGITAALGAGALAAVLPMCAPPPPPTIQQQVVDLTNARRAENGLAPLTVNGTLTAVAQAHAADQASVDRMSHTGTDGSDPATRIIRSGYPVRVWGENVAGGYTSSEAVTAAWMESPSHRAIILDGRFREIGVGLAYAPDGSAYWSLELGRRQ